jgi:hypothetical protein
MMHGMDAMREAPPAYGPVPSLARSKNVEANMQVRFLV